MTARRTPAEVDTEPGGAGSAEWAGYRLGDPISLADLLALPGSEDDRLDRDDEGRLRRMAPDHGWHQRYPLGRFITHLNRTLDPRFEVFPEPGLLLERLILLRGHAVPPSRLGLQTIEPDIAIFDGPPHDLQPPPTRGRYPYPTTGLAVVVELLSPSTFRQDLGLGRSDELDRWASYLASGVPELWVLNVGTEPPCPMPVGSSLFLRNAGSRWEPLPVVDPVHVEGEVHGLRPLTSGQITSTAAITTLDLAALWATFTPRR